MYPILILMLIVSALMMQQANMRALQGAASQQQIKAEAQFFLNYRSAVMAYVQATPTASGAISTSSLAPYAGQFYSSAFLSLAGNNVTASGSGKLVTVYAALPPGVLNLILKKSGNDASIGLSSGTTWTSQANGVVNAPQPLPIPVPANNIVSVFAM
ncbi:MAG: type IV pilus biogenesis protein PilM [Rhodanobacter sp.]